MPLPVVNDCYKVTLVWACPAAPRSATTSFYFLDTSGAGNENGLYTAINANVTTNMWFHTVNTAFVETVNITKLDGVSAGVAFATGSPAKWGGNSVPDLIPQGAYVISIKSAQRGPRGRNRMFLPWCSETEQTNGVLNAGNTTTCTTAWNTFAAAVAAGPYEMTVVSPQYQDNHPYTSILCRPYLKTQRRRSRR